MTTARTEILSVVRRAGGASAVDQRPEPLVRQLHMSDVIDAFCERAADYKASVHRCAADGVTAKLAQLMEQRGAAQLAAPAALLAGCPLPTNVRPDDNLAISELASLDGAVTGSAGAVAESGTVLLNGATSGRRALSLVPDWHICLVRAETIAATMSEALQLVDLDYPVTLVAGPSATSDIELERVEGVHGPRTLDILVVG